MKNLLGHLLIFGCLLALPIKAKATSEGKLLAYTENGKITSYTLSKVKEGGMLDKAGMVEGDRLVSVNSIKLMTNKSRAAAIKELFEKEYSELLIIRDNMPMTLTYQNKKKDTK